MLAIIEADQENFFRSCHARPELDFALIKKYAFGLCAAERGMYQRGQSLVPEPDHVIDEGRHLLPKQPGCGHDVENAFFGFYPQAIFSLFADGEEDHVLRSRTR